MRRPLRYQIMLPMLAVMLATVVGASGFEAYLAARRTKGQIERQLRNVAETLNGSSFPLTDAVLRQMRGLSGAEFVLTQESGSRLAASLDVGELAELPIGEPAEHWDSLRLGNPLRLGGERYFHAVMRLQRANAPGERSLLHIFYPEQSYREAWWNAVYPPLAVGGASLLIVALLAAAVASRVSRPMAQLRQQVERIAEGQFDALPLPERNDEVLDLARSVNRMVEMLGRYEDEVRRTERLRALGQLGGGNAHQLRNSATGCRMALDIHRRECPLGHDCESLEVAKRQLTLMEKYLQRFLSLGRGPARPREDVNVVELMDHLLPLVRPAAEHAGVDLRCLLPDTPMFVRGDGDGLEQLIVNLLLNAIEAASRRDASLPSSPDERTVVVKLDRLGDDRLVLAVEDSGPGPAAAVRDDLFEALVSEKANGAGLGLSVAREVVHQHGGSIRWERRGRMTCFLVELPLPGMESHCVEAAGR